MLQRDGIIFGRVFGAMGWPSQQPGSAVVVGEEYYLEPGTSTRHLHVLDLKREYDDIYEAIGGSEKYRSRFLKLVGKTRPHY